MDQPTSPPTLAQRLVGLFVAWQLVFLLAANLFYFLWQTAPRDADGARGAVREFLPRLTAPYARATGQLQGWSLYAPDVPHRAAFVAVELRWPDRPPLKLLSPNEPPDLLSFFRHPGTGRLLNYEANLRLVLLTWSPEKVAAHPDFWRKEVAQRVRLLAGPLRAYLGWRRDQYLRQHPQTPPPSELILWIRLYEIGPPGQHPWDWPGPTEVPLARWRPGHEPDPGYLPIEMYDVTVWPYNRRGFERVREAP